MIITKKFGFFKPLLLLLSIKFLGRAPKTLYSIKLDLPHLPYLNHILFSITSSFFFFSFPLSSFLFSHFVFNIYSRYYLLLTTYLLFFSLPSSKHSLVISIFSFSFCLLFKPLLYYSLHIYFLFCPL